MPYANHADHIAQTQRYRLANRDRLNDRAKTYYRENRRSIEDQRLRRVYGVGLDEKETILAQQDGRCAVCQRPLHGDKQTHLDHNHATDQVRGVLCQQCNHMLGAIHEDPAILAAAIEYLARWNQ